MELHDDKDDGGTQGNEKKCGALVKIEQSGVRRKLFQDDGTDAPGAYQDFITMSICEQGTQMCNRNWSRELKPEAKQESTYNTEGKEISVLVISSYKDVRLMKMIESQTKVTVNNSILPCDVSHSFPESAYRLATIKSFSLILLDLNNDYVENSLKISQSIRASSVTNSSTPIIAFRHADVIKDEIWKKNGVTEVVYGPLYHSAVDQICDKYLNWFTQRDYSEEEDQNSIHLTASTTQRQDEFKVPSVPATNKFATECSIETAASKTTWTASRNESPIQACDSTDQITPYCEIDASGGTVQVQDESCSTYENDKNPCSQGGTFSSCPTNCLMPLSVTTVSRQMPMDSAVGCNSNVAQIDTNGVKTSQPGWNFIQQILDLHQNVQKDNDQKSKQVIHPLDGSTLAGTKHVSSQSPVTAYPVAAQYSTMMKNYPGASMLQSQMPQNTGYMVSGTPETGNMKLSLIPDEYAKHSNKERERRERIKDSCDELRKILPKQLMIGRRQDMATVLEMTVYYLKVVQDHLPTVIQQQLYQSFMTYTDNKQRRKRKGTVDMAQTLPSMVQKKLQRLSNGATSNSSNGYPIISYGATNYMTQVMPPSNYQQANTGHLPPLYHPLLSNPYHATVNSSSIQSICGSTSLPSLDHVMHLRSQCYNDNQQLQNGIPCYAVATSSPRDNGNAAVQRQDLGKSSFIN